MLPCDGYGSTRKKFRRSVPRMQKKVRFKDCTINSCLNGKIHKLGKIF